MFKYKFKNPLQLVNNQIGGMELYELIKIPTLGLEQLLSRDSNLSREIEKIPFTTTMLFEILLENLLGNQNRYKLYESEIKEYFTSIDNIYIIDFENYRYQYVNLGFSHYDATQEALKYISEFIYPNMLIILCTNNPHTHENLLTYINQHNLQQLEQAEKREKIEQSEKREKIEQAEQVENAAVVTSADLINLSNVFTLYFNEEKKDGTQFDFSASDDLLFWLYAMAVRKIINETCPSYQNIEYKKPDNIISLDSTCKLHLITSDKQKLYDNTQKSDNLKNLYTIFKKSKLDGIIKFYINNNHNPIISNILKSFLIKFTQNQHRPNTYLLDYLGINLKDKCRDNPKSCDFFEIFIRNIKILQHRYFPNCATECLCKTKKICVPCECSLYPDTMLKFQ
jgi:hypothetical protein